jgi:exodeoxyribonuclease VII large subunit
VKESTEALIAGLRLHIFHLLSSYAFSRPEDMLHQHTQHLDRIQKSLSMLASHTLTLTSSRLRAAQQRLEALNPALPMERGFALVRKAGTLIRSSAVLQTNDNVSLEFIDGKRKATIN